MKREVSWILANWNMKCAQKHFHVSITNTRFCYSAIQNSRLDVLNSSEMNSSVNFAKISDFSSMKVKLEIDFFTRKCQLSETAETFEEHNKALLSQAKEKFPTSLDFQGKKKV